MCGFAYTCRCVCVYVTVCMRVHVGVYACVCACMREHVRVCTRTGAHIVARARCELRAPSLRGRSAPCLPAIGPQIWIAESADHRRSSSPSPDTVRIRK